MVRNAMEFAASRALACAVLAATWLGERDLSLSRELAQATRANDEHERVVASMAEEQKRPVNRKYPMNSSRQDHRPFQIRSGLLFSPSSACLQAAAGRLLFRCCI